jgi:hypothetical protein
MSTGVFRANCGFQKSPAKLGSIHFRLDGEHLYAWDEETLTKELR